MGELASVRSGAPRQPFRRLASAVLVALMCLLAFGLWTLIPLAWIWLASQLQSTSQPSFGAYALVLLGIPVTVIGLARLLSSLDRVHDRMTGRRRRRERAAWLRSMRGERGSTHEVTALDRVMIATFVVAALAMAVWFFFFARYTLPA